MTRSFTRLARHRATPPTLITFGALLAAALILPVPFAGAQDTGRQEAQECTCRIGPEDRHRDWPGTRDGDACVCRVAPEEALFGFSWPAEGAAGRAWSQLFAGQAARARLGISFSTDEVEGEPAGVRVTGVTRDSGAEDAGLRRGDVIVSAGGHELSRPLPDESPAPSMSPAAWRFSELARDLDPGDTIRIVYRRNGATHEAEVEARSLPAVFAWTRGPERRLEVRAPDAPMRLEGLRAPRIEVRRGVAPFPVEIFATRGQRAYGLELRDLNEELGAYFGRSEGVVVLDVADDAPIPLRAGDVLLAIGDREVRDAAHAREIMRTYRSGESLEIRVWRERTEVTVRGEAR